ncbi:hypothetical protein LTR28_009648 [Elasticomyces elasticus]|nr:hypothetical protein LTR28_009648 [Elasticomyces elasticus]
MHLTCNRIATVLGLTAVANAHFVLQVPTSLGFDDGKESESPCGSFDPTGRSTGVTDWALGGNPVELLTTHTRGTWDIKVALLSDVTKFVSLLPVVDQSGVGTFCLPAVPGKAEWVGSDAVLQITQSSPDGMLYQVKSPLSFRHRMN